ncbi:MAG: DUF1579 domain-containing protein [Kofleriaceae bacterium]|nr:MAG: DUF1579 domain-containing protein [Kofleriaceae bacterium]
MEMPTVSKEMARLTELFAGTWRGEETLFPSEWDPVGGPATGTWTVRAAVDGFALLVDYDEERDGKLVYRGHGVHGWDAREGAFFAYWFDNVGVMQKAGNRATLDGDRYTYTELSDQGQSRFTYEWHEGVFTFAIDRSADGKDWKPMHHGRYRQI